MSTSLALSPRLRTGRPDPCEVSDEDDVGRPDLGAAHTDQRRRVDPANAEKALGRPAEWQDRPIVSGIAHAIPSSRCIL